LPTATTICRARQRRGMSMSHLARLVGVTRPAIYLWEKGERHPRPRYARRLESALGLPPGCLNENGAASEETAP